MDTKMCFVCFLSMYTCGSYVTLQELFAKNTEPILVFLHKDPYTAICTHEYVIRSSARELQIPKQTPTLHYYTHNSFPNALSGGILVVYLCW